MSSRKLITQYFRTGQRVCEYYAKHHQYEMASTVLQAMLDVDWLSEDQKLNIRSNQKLIEAWRLCHLGERCYDKGNLKEAVTYFLQSCTIAEEKGDFFCMQRDYSNLGLALVSSQKYGEAIDFFLKHLNMSLLLGDESSIKYAYRNICNAYIRISDFVSAIKYTSESLQRFEKTGDREGQMNGYLILGEACGSTGNTAESISNYEKAMELAQVLKDKKGEGYAYNGLGTQYTNLADFDNAVIYQKMFLDIALELNDSKMKQMAYLELGLHHYIRNDYATAMPFVEKALEIAQEVQDKGSQCICHCYLGVIAFAQSKMQTALDHYRKSLGFLKEQGNKVNEGATYISMSKVLLAMGDYKKALETSNKVLELARETNERILEVQALRGIGDVLQSTQEYGEAIEVYKERMSIYKKLNDKKGMAYSHGELGSSYVGLGKYMLAVAYLKQQLKLFQELGDKAGEGNAHGNLGNAYFMLNCQEKAVVHYSESLKISREIENKMSEGRNLGNLANTYQQLGNFEEAFENYAKQANLAKSTFDLEGEAFSYYNVGLLHKKIDNLVQAEVDVRKCIEILLDVRLLMQNEDALKVSIGEKHVRAYKMLSEILLKQVRTEDAFLACDKGRALALKDLMRRRLGVKLDNEQAGQDVEVDVKSCLHSLKQTIETTTLAYTSFDDEFWIWVICKDGVSVKITSNEVGVEPVLQKLKIITEDLCGDLNARGEGDQDLEEHDDNIELEDFFAVTPEKEPHPSKKFSGKLVEDLDNLTLEEVEKMENSLSEDGYAEETQGLSQQTSHDGGELENAAHLAETRAQQPSDAQSENENPLRALYDILIKPVEEHIQGSHLVIIPEGFLFKVPYCAIIDSKGKYLSDRFSIQVCPSLETLSLCNPRAQDLGGALVVGNPKLGTLNVRGEIKLKNALPGAQREAEDVAALFGTTALVLEQATKAKVLKLLPEAGVVHIASHGDFLHGEIYLAPPQSHGEQSARRDCDDEINPDNLPSEEEFLLTCSDIANLHFRGTKLVVLSCCHTANGTIKSAEGVVGIARSFLGAGAASVLVSLWKLSDGETKYFMTNFWRFLLQGFSCCVAVQKSMNMMREADILYWAPFFVIGQDVKLTAEDIEQIKLHKCF